MPFWRGILPENDIAALYSGAKVPGRVSTSIFVFHRYPIIAGLRLAVTTRRNIVLIHVDLQYEPLTCRCVPVEGVSGAR